MTNEWESEERQRATRGSGTNCRSPVPRENDSRKSGERMGAGSLAEHPGDDENHIRAEETALKYTGNDEPANGRQGREKKKGFIHGGDMSAGKASN